MWPNLGICLGVGAALVAAWYVLFLHLHRRRSLHILRYIEEALDGAGRITSMHWHTASKFEVRLRLQESCFRHPRLLVNLLPREMPLHWLFRRNDRETLTFEADLNCPPTYNIAAQSHRWLARTRSKLNVNACWQAEKLGPFVITSRPEWERDIMNAIELLSSSHDCEFMNVRVWSRTPQISATVPLALLESQHGPKPPIFTVLKELAGSSTTRM